MAYRLCTVSALLLGCLGNASAQLAQPAARANPLWTPQMGFHHMFHQGGLFDLLGLKPSAEEGTVVTGTQHQEGNDATGAWTKDHSTNQFTSSSGRSSWFSESVSQSSTRKSGGGSFFGSSSFTVTTFGGSPPQQEPKQEEHGRCEWESLPERRLLVSPALRTSEAHAADEAACQAWCEQEEDCMGYCWHGAQHAEHANCCIHSPPAGAAVADAWRMLGSAADDHMSSGLCRTAGSENVRVVALAQHKKPAVSMPAKEAAGEKVAAAPEPTKQDPPAPARTDDAAADADDDANDDADDCHSKYTDQKSCDADKTMSGGCTWCKCAALPSACWSLADAKKLPSGVYQCDAHKPASFLEEITENLRGLWSDVKGIVKSADKL